MMNMIDTTREQDADHRFAAAAVESFIGDTMTAVGLPAADGAKVTQLMTEADLTGADGHGVWIVSGNPAAVRWPAPRKQNVPSRGSAMAHIEKSLPC